MISVLLCYKGKDREYELPIVPRAGELVSFGDDVTFTVAGVEHLPEEDTIRVHLKEGRQPGDRPANPFEAA